MKILLALLLLLLLLILNKINLSALDPHFLFSHTSRKFDQIPTSTAALLNGFRFDPQDLRSLKLTIAPSLEASAWFLTESAPRRKRSSIRLEINSTRIFKWSTSEYLVESLRQKRSDYEFRNHFASPRSARNYEFRNHFACSKSIQLRYTKFFKFFNRHPVGRDHLFALINSTWNTKIYFSSSSETLVNHQDLFQFFKWNPCRNSI